MTDQEYLDLKKERREIGDRLDAGNATASEMRRYRAIVAQIQADPPTPAQVYLGIGG